MSVATVKTHLALLQEQIPGILTAYHDAPASIDGANAPLFVNFAGPATYDLVSLGEQYDLEKRQYNMRLYAIPAGQGGPGDAENLCEGFFPAVRDFFLARPSLGGLQNVIKSYLLNDTGIVNMLYNDRETSWYGIEFRLMVWEYIQVNYAQNE